jgi:hypothetical protein
MLKEGAKINNNALFRQIIHKLLNYNEIIIFFFLYFLFFYVIQRFLFTDNH